MSHNIEQLVPTIICCKSFKKLNNKSVNLYMLCESYVQDDGAIS